MAYKLRGVPQMFETEDDALSFLRNSPGYVRRQRTYLKRFWPGLYAQTAKVTGQERQVLEGRSAKLRGKKSKNVFDLIGEGATAVARAGVESVLTQAHGAGKPQRGPVKVPTAARAALAGGAVAGKGFVEGALGSESRKALAGQSVNPLLFGVEAASILPIGKGLRGARAAAKAAKAAREAERVAKPVAKTAVEHADPVVQKAREQLKSAPGLRREQEKGYHAARKDKAARLTDALLIDGPEGDVAIREALKGELPKLHFAGFEDFSPQTVLHLRDVIKQTDALRPFEKVTALDSVSGAVQGRVPTTGELALLRKVFGDDVAADVTSGHSLLGNLMDVWNLPRAVAASFDLSAPLRQGLVAGARHPIILAKNFRPMIKSFIKQGHFDDVQDNIASRENFSLYSRGNLALTDLGDNLLKREEQYVSRLAGKVPGIKQSQRGYVAFLNKMRADVFDHLLEQARKNPDVADRVDSDEFLRSLSSFVNAATGRGDLGRIENWGPMLNTFLFSPRLLASRINFLNPAWYMKQDPWVRKQALRAAFQTTAAVTGVVTLAGLAGAKVVSDATNADFGKIRVGDSRFDVGGGFLPIIRLVEQLRQGKITSSTTGKELKLNQGGFGDLSKYDIAERFAFSKLAPSPSLVKDWLKGTNFLGQEFQWDEAVATRMIPLLMQDSYEIYQHEGGGPEGLAKAAGAYGIGMWGIGSQTYPDERQRPRKSVARYGKPTSRSRGGGLSNKPSRSSNKP